MTGYTHGHCSLVTNTHSHHNLTSSTLRHYFLTPTHHYLAIWTSLVSQAHPLCHQDTHSHHHLVIWSLDAIWDGPLFGWEIKISYDWLLVTGHLYLATRTHAGYFLLTNTLFVTITSSCHQAWQHSHYLSIATNVWPSSACLELFLMRQHRAVSLHSKNGWLQPWLQPGSWRARVKSLWQGPPVLLWQWPEQGTCAHVCMPNVCWTKKHGSELICCWYCIICLLLFHSMYNFSDSSPRDVCALWTSKRAYTTINCTLKLCEYVCVCAYVYMYVCQCSCVTIACDFLF